MSEFMDLLQCSAMATTLLMAWLVGSRTVARRLAGF